MGEALQQSQLLPRLLGCASSNHDQKHNRGFSLFPSIDFMALILPLCCGELLHRRTVCLHFYTSDLLAAVLSSSVSLLLLWYRWLRCRFLVCSCAAHLSSYPSIVGKPLKCQSTSGIPSIPRPSRSKTRGSLCCFRRWECSQRRSD